MAGKVFWTVRRSKVVSRVQTNFIKTAQVADTPQEWHGSIENMISMCRGTGAVTVAATDSGEAQTWLMKRALVISGETCCDGVYDIVTAEESRRQVGGAGEDERERATAGLGGEVHFSRPRGTHHVSVATGTLSRAALTMQCSSWEEQRLLGAAYWASVG